MKVIVEAKRTESSALVVLTDRCPQRCVCPGCPGYRPNQ